MRRFLLLLIFVLSAAVPRPVRAGIITVMPCTESVTAVHLVITHLDISGSEVVHNVQACTLWQISLDITEKPGGPIMGDAIYISGFLQHMTAVPGHASEKATGDKQLISGWVKGLGSPMGTNTATGYFEANHPRIGDVSDHTDSYVFVTEWTVGWFSQIESYTLDIKGSHTAETPEPGTLVLVVFGIGVLWILRMRRNPGPIS